MKFESSDFISDVVYILDVSLVETYITIEATDI